MSTRRIRMPAEANTAAWFFLAPALILIGVFFFLPVAAALVLSVTDFDLYGIANPANTRFIGLQNYIRLLHTPDFWSALKNTFYFAFVGGPLTIAVALGAALLLSSKLVRFKGFFRTVYFTPFVTTLVAVAIVWRYLYHTRYGLFNYGLAHLGIGPIDWLSFKCEGTRYGGSAVSSRPSMDHILECITLLPTAGTRDVPEKWWLSR